MEPIKKLLPSIADAESFKFITYLLEKNGDEDPSILIPFFHENQAIKKNAIYAVGIMPNKMNHVEEFIACLQEDDPTIIHTTVQALRDVNDSRLLPYYEKLLRVYAKNEHYILTNIMLRLEELGDSAKDLLELTLHHPHLETREKAASILEKLPAAHSKRKWFGGWGKK
ncbi:MAG: HEAT repeat domain-containing protein [Candidatus Pristimantibacillus sp.]